MSERDGRRGWMLVAGALVLVGLVGAAVVMWIAAGDRRADNVAGFARAPMGCDTTLDFESTGTFVLYIETSGEIGELAGACDAQLRYDRDDDDIPQVELTLRDADGDDVELAEARDVSYDVDGFVGVSAHEVEIATPGDHVLTVAPTGGDAFAIAVGRTPDEGVALLRWGAVAAAIGGLLVGGLLLVLGSRRPAPTTPPPDPWTPDAEGWPSSPPGFPVPPPTTGATGPAGPPLTTPPTPTLTPTSTPTSPLPPAPTRPASSPPSAPNDDQHSPWAPPSSPQ
ncbi:MAG TPA: hypothetical protein VLN74_15485 [Ilumatobacteraceae bacterium]|nr:hypothetical protein [Ilumatobacteraceae bacterium]